MLKFAIILLILSLSTIAINSNFYSSVNIESSDNFNNLNSLNSLTNFNDFDNDFQSDIKENLIRSKL